VAEDWYTLAGRLRWAVFEHQPPEGRQRGLRLFQRKIDDRTPAVPGSSLSAIQSYLRGDAEPTPRFLLAAAQLLAVRPEWLAWGIGAPTEEEEAARRESPEEELQRLSTAVYQALGVPTSIPAGTVTTQHPEGTPDEMARFWGPAIWAPVVRQTALRLYQLRIAWAMVSGEQVPSGPEADHSWDTAHLDLATAIAAPLRSLEIDGQRLNLSDVGDYVQDVALALQRVFRQYSPPTETQDAFIQED
jgi:hypothetical protein